MESIEQFKNNVKNDERRLKFFVDKLKSDLKKINIQYDDETLKELILNAIEKYNDHPHQFGNYVINQIKENNKDKTNYPKNDIFSDREMAIINLYLEKDDNDKYRSTEEIAHTLGTEILTVSSTIYKLKTELSEHPKNVEKIFGNIEHIITEHRKIKPKRKVKKQENKNTELTDDDMKILGSFTGQINDICIDIEDLASERGLKPQEMKDKIIDLYDLLENEENYKKLITRFPQITLMLKFKGKSIGAKIPVIVTTNGNPVFECANFFQTLYQKDDNDKYISTKTAMNKLGYIKASTFYSRKKVLENKLEEDDDFKRKVLERYPTLFEDKEQYEQSSTKRRKSNNVPSPKEEVPEEIKQDVKLLKYFYKLHDGKYYSESIIAELMEMTTAQVIRKKEKILKQMKKTKEYETQILDQYPELYKNIEVYNNAPDDIKNSGISPKVIHADVKYLKLMYTKDPISGKYRSSSEIANILDISMNTFFKNRKRILNELENNSEYKTAITKEWPLLNHNIEMYNKDKNKNKNKAKDKKTKNEEKMKKLIKTLEYFFKKRPDGTYYTYSEIAKLLEIKEISIYRKREYILKKLEDKEIKAKILEKWPTIDKDIKARNNFNQIHKTHKDSQIQIDNDIKILKLFYKKQPNGTYLSNKEIAKILEIGESSTYQKKANILKRLENKDYKAKILEKWPTLDKDIKNRPNITTDLNKQIDKDIKVLKLFYKKQSNGKYPSNKEIAKILEIGENSTYQKKANILKRLEDTDYKTKILEKWPTIDKDIKTRNNFDKTNKTHKTNKTNNDKQIDKDIKTLKLFYKKQPDGTYLSNKEVAKLLEIGEGSASRRRIIALKRLEDKDYKAKILEKWPTIDKDIEKRPNFNGKNDLNKQIDNDIKVLKLFYKKQPDGTYLSNKEIAKSLEIGESSIYQKRLNIMERLEDKTYKAKILEKWPTLDEDIKNRPNFTGKTDINKQIDKDIKVLKLFYKKQPDGTYLSNKEIAKLLEVGESSVSQRKKYILERLEDKDYKAKIIEKWPTLDEDIKKRPNFKGKNDLNKQIDKDIKVLKLFYKKQPDDTYLSNKEIAKSLEIGESSVSQRKKYILERLEDKDYKAKILEKWPTLDEDIKKRPNFKGKNDLNKQIDKDIKVLKLFYKKQPDDTYLSNKEIAKSLEIGDSSISNRKKTILKRLENKTYKAKILEKWPTLDEDIEKRSSFTGKKDLNKQIDENIEARANEVTDDKLTEKEEFIANMLLTDENRTFEKVTTNARHLNISENYFSILKNKTITKIGNNPILQSNYPHFMEENEIAANYRKKNSISISPEELNNIRNNARRYDFPNTKRNTKDNLIKGIEKLEKSIYGDYASLCTVEQKAMLALRLGFFNNMEFSTETVSIFFKTDKEEVSQLTSECIKSARKEKAAQNAQKKIGTKN